MPADPPASLPAAVLLCNLGTPDEPTPVAVRRYLAQFLGDPRVVDLPRIAWLPILYGLILPLRAPRSAAKYRTIWMPEGSPLKVWTARQARRLQERLGLRVEYAMRYGNPPIGAQLDALAAAGAARIVVLSAYPQYSGTTTSSVADAVDAWRARQPSPPQLRLVERYHDDAGYIEALALRIERHWRAHGRPDHFVMSFHGVPQRTVERGDPYADECRTTARLLAQRLGLAGDEYTLTFQSRFGKAKWLEPYTEATLVALAGAGKQRVDVACPGFIADCLETLEEIAQEARDAFLHAGGRQFHYIPCLNDEAEWIEALGKIALRGLAAPDA